MTHTETGGSPEGRMAGYDLFHILGPALQSGRE